MHFLRIVKKKQKQLWKITIELFCKKAILVDHWHVLREWAIRRIRQTHLFRIMKFRGYWLVLYHGVQIIVVKPIGLAFIHASHPCDHGLNRWPEFEGNCARQTHFYWTVFSIKSLKENKRNKQIINICSVSLLITISWPLHFFFV